MFEWNLETSLVTLGLIEECEGMSLWWKIRQGWNQHTLMWDVWNRVRERELRG